MRSFSSLAILAIAVCFGALLAACLSRGNTSRSSSCSCGTPEEIAPAQLRITESSAGPELIGADVDVTPGKVEIRTREGVIVFRAVKR